MNFTVSLLPLAVDDLADAYAHYEETSAGLGDRFHDVIAAMLRRIEMNPLLYAVSGASPYRKAMVAEFPYCIYYAVHGAKIAVIAVHCSHRDPGIWRRRAT